MSDIPPGLLPEGLRDRLPPQAEAQARMLRAVIDCVAAHGYDRVSPPLAEFEDTLARQLKSTSRQDLLRLVDPVSGRTLALRPDITAQVGRIAATRLADAPRPLRLCYGGTVIKLRASQLRPEREMTQIGAELIGNDGVHAAREIAALSVEALTAAGARGITIDLTMPDLIDIIADDALPVPAARRDELNALLDAKDAGGLAQAGFEAWIPLVAATGPLEPALDQLARLASGPVIAERLDALRRIAAGLNARVTFDPTERHGFAYQSWFGFSILVDGLAGEIGRGGSYAILHADGREEPAIGFSLYPDALLDRLARDGAQATIFLPLDHDAAAAARLRADGWRTIAAVCPACDATALGCTHRLDGDTPVAL